ncbi:MAG: 3-methyl-2-oxobutanoate hydroxymethyltransferase [Phycisphaerales bacterium]|nr:3-methyl-2-oxobutanoate hydroxymethyltransferase [Phycisphaerales bacterium]
MSQSDRSQSGPVSPGAATNPVTLRTLQEMAAAGMPFACLTCYDATMARWLSRGGVHVLLVGDTAAEMVLGFSRTIDMPLEVLIALTAGVKRGAPDRVVMADMPFMSYQADEGTAIRNAGRFLTEGMADIVKVEADASFAPVIGRMSRAGVPICGHIGSRPQLATLEGGYKAAGRTATEANQIVADAMALEDAGCRQLLIEAVPPEVTELVLNRTRVPVIGIGAGPRCHGQVLVVQDLLGMTEHPPRFADPVAQLGDEITGAAAEWVRRVGERATGGQAYKMRPGEAAQLEGTQPLADGKGPAGASVHTYPSGNGGGVRRPQAERTRTPGV